MSDLPPAYDGPPASGDNPTIIHHHHHHSSHNGAGERHGEDHEPQEFRAQREEYERRQRQLALDEEAARRAQQVYTQETQVLEDEHARRAFEHVTAQRALMSVNRQRAIPEHHDWIIYVLQTVSGFTSFVGFGMIIGTIWAYFKDLHLSRVSDEKDNLLFLQILAIFIAFMIFFQGTLGNMAMKKPEKARKWILNIAMYGYLFVTLVAMFLSLFCLNVIYNTRIEMFATQKLIKSTYTNPYDIRIGTESAASMSTSNPLPVAPPYGNNEAVFARYFNLIYFGAISSNPDESAVEACSDSVFIMFWGYIRDHCPPTLAFDRCIHCQDYSVASCYASEARCDQTQEGAALASPLDRNQGCPYQICRSYIIDDGLKKIFYLQYGLEGLVGFQILICISLLVYAWEYSVFYRTQEEVNECYKPENMQNGIYRNTTDLNDAIMRTDMLHSVIYPQAQEEEVEQRDAQGRYSHVFAGPGGPGDSRGASPGGSPRNPGGSRNSPAIASPGSRNVTVDHTTQARL